MQKTEQAAKLQEIKSGEILYGDQKPTGDMNHEIIGWLMLGFLFCMVIIISYHYGLYLNPEKNNWVI